jgi:hypothetical protein
MGLEWEAWHCAARPLPFVEGLLQVNLSMFFLGRAHKAPYGRALVLAALAPRARFHYASTIESRAFAHEACP